MNPESKTNAFKKNLALVFDDDLRTRPLRWNNYVDIVIITRLQQRPQGHAEARHGL
jgi:hypothetical protein